MGKPFSDLDAQVIAILASGGDPLQSQDNAVKQYWAWKLNPSSNAHDLPDAATRTQGRRLTEVALTPFSLDLGTGYFAKVTISERSAGFYDSKYSDLGITTIAAGTNAIRLGKFTPARVYARTGASATPEPRTSRITGRKYKSYYAENDQGYSAPFGKQSATDTEFDRQVALDLAVRTIGTGTDLVTFTPEKAKA